MLPVRVAVVLQAQAIHVIDVIAYKCHTCDYFAEKARRECRELGHNIASMKVKKRFYCCSKCKEHVSVLNRKLPDGPCKKCGSVDSWKEAGLKRSNAAPSASAEFMPRGEELGKFRNSAPLPSYAAIGSDAEANSTGKHHNAWQSSLPVLDGSDAF